MLDVHDCRLSIASTKSKHKSNSTFVLPLSTHCKSKEAEEPRQHIGARRYIEEQHRRYQLTPRQHLGRYIHTSSCIDVHWH